MKSFSLQFSNISLYLAKYEILGSGYFCEWSMLICGIYFILWTFLGIICLWNCYKSFPLWLNISNFFILYTILHQIFCMYVYVFVQDWYVARNCWGPRMSNLMYATILPFRFIVPISRSWAAMFDSLLLPWPPSLACLQLMLSNC